MEPDRFVEVPPSAAVERAEGLGDASEHTPVAPTKRPPGDTLSSAPKAHPDNSPWRVRAPDGHDMMI